MFITGCGTAVPSHRYTQEECWEAVQVSPHFATLKPRSRQILRKVFLGDNGIETRSLALENLSDAFDLRPDVLQKRFETHAPALAVAAAEKALRSAARSAASIDAVLISTCTGYLCPGLTSYVAERLGLRRDVFHLDLVGQGCSAAIPNLRTASCILAANEAKTILSVCVEVCSAALYLDDDPGVLISACLFGDGAGAVVLESTHRPPSPKIKWMTSQSCLIPALRDQLRFEHKNGMLRNILNQSVPTLIQAPCREILNEVLARTGLSQTRIAAWLLHAGGRNVLMALQDSLRLTEADLEVSARVLRLYGNLSSPSVLFVLEEMLKCGGPAGLWWMSSFGAGVSCHGALLEVTR